MDWNAFKPLLVDATDKMLRLSIKSQTAAQPPDLNKVLACLQDGTIDPGDLEQVSKGLLGIIVAMPEYQDVVTFARERRHDYRKLYTALAESSEADYEKYIELTQAIAADMVTAALFQVLLAAGIVKDARPKN